MIIVQGIPLLSREGLRTSKDITKVCKLQEECEEVTKKTKDFKEKTLKPTEEIPNDKGERVKKRIQNPNHRFQKVNLNSKNINLCLLLQRWRKNHKKRKLRKN